MKVSELLSDRSRWLQGTFAKDRAGKDTCSWEAGAVSFCLLGALNRCYPDHHARLDAKQKVVRLLPPAYEGSMMRFNDSNTFESVKQLVLAAGV